MQKMGQTKTTCALIKAEVDRHEHIIKYPGNIDCCAATNYYCLLSKDQPNDVSDSPIR